MIKVLVETKNNYIQHVLINGHANSDDYGKDLVCAGVSAVGIGICNTIASKDFIDEYCLIDLKDGNIDIQVIKANEQLQLILETLVISLKSFKTNNDYSKYITIKEELL